MVIVNSTEDIRKHLEAANDLRVRMNELIAELKKLNLETNDHIVEAYVLLDKLLRLPKPSEIV